MRDGVPCVRVSESWFGWAQSTWPHLDVEAEFMESRAWALENEDMRPKWRNVEAFLARWMERAELLLRPSGAFKEGW